MKNQFILICIGIIINLSLLGQSLVFEKVFDWTSKDQIIDFIPTEDQGFAMLGQSGSNLFVMKLDTIGDLVWKNNIGVVNIHTWHTWFYQIIQSQNSDLIVVGRYLSDAILLRLSSSGDSISSILYPYLIDDNSFIGVVELDNYDLIISERREQDNGNYPPRVYLRGFSAAGNLKWSKEIGDEHYPFNMILTEDYNIVTTGLWEWYGPRIWVSKYDTLGNQLSDIILNSSRGNQIIESSDGYYYSAVDGYSSSGDYKAIKLDSDCNVEWKLNNYNGSNYYANTICQLEPNRFAIGGAVQNNVDILIFNENGDSISSFIYDDYYTYSVERIFTDQTNLTIGSTIISNNNNSILVLQISLDSLYTSINTNSVQSNKIEPAIFPNPATSIIDLSDYKVLGILTKVLIFNINGELQLIESFESGDNLRINIDSLRDGYYIAKIITENKTYYDKFIKK